MITWSGYGLLVFVIAFADSLVANFLTNYITKDKTFYDRNLLPFGISILFSALFVKLLSDYFAKKKEENKGPRIFDNVTIGQGDKNHLFLFHFVIGVIFCWFLELEV